MRKIIVVFEVLLTLGMISACSSGDDTENLAKDSSLERSKGIDGVGILPVENGGEFSEIYSFFDSELPFCVKSKGFFGDSNLGVGDERCLIVNSRKELEDIYSGNNTIPEIDFQRYNLVIGVRIMPAYGYKCVRQVLIPNKGGSSAILNLYIENKYEYNPCADAPLYFWGLYPIISLSTIKTNIILL